MISSSSFIKTFFADASTAKSGDEDSSRERNDEVQAQVNPNEISNKASLIPYCIESDVFELCVDPKDFGVKTHHKGMEEKIQFQMVLYPRGKYSKYNTDTSASTNDTIQGYAGAYLKFLPLEHGDEVDITWKLRLLDTRDTREMNRPSNSDNTRYNKTKTLPILSSGGLPRSKDTWSAGMCFCSEIEAMESIGRVSDWGCSSWSARDVCDALGYLKAEGTITVHGMRKRQSKWQSSTGTIRALTKTVFQSSQIQTKARPFQVGEVIVPIKDLSPQQSQSWNTSFICPGVDYRIMTMSDQYGNPIFSSNSVPKNERSEIRLALRPVGWNMQQQMWKKRGWGWEDWPMEIPANYLSSTCVSRFNVASMIPRFTSAFTRDWKAFTLAILLAISPIPITLLGRNALSLYVIPSASMDPTLVKGDVLLVEKLPNVYDRTKRGDVIFFNPPPSLINIISGSTNANSNIGGNSLFVKRLVGIPGDQDIAMDPQTLEVTIGGKPAMGPNRNLCEDEPLKLIDRLLQKGQGKSLDQLRNDDVYVLGDCKSISVDSRVFGVLPKENIVGRPLARIWPLNRFTFKSL